MVTKILWPFPLRIMACSTVFKSSQIQIEIVLVELVTLFWKCMEEVTKVIFDAWNRSQIVFGSVELVTLINVASGHDHNFFWISGIGHIYTSNQWTTFWLSQFDSSLVEMITILFAITSKVLKIVCEGEKFRKKGWIASSHVISFHLSHQPHWTFPVTTLWVFSLFELGQVVLFSYVYLY